MFLFSWQYSLAANAIRDIQECEQAHELGAINSTLRYVVHAHSTDLVIAVLLLDIVTFCKSKKHALLHNCTCVLEIFLILYNCLLFCL